MRTDSLTLSVTPQIAPEADRDAEPDADRESAAPSRSPTCLRAWSTARRWRCPGSRTIARSRERKRVGISGGWFGRATVVTRKRVELVILSDAEDRAPASPPNNMYETLLRVHRKAVQPDAGSEVSLPQRVARQRLRPAAVRDQPARRLRRRHRRHRHRQDDAVPRAARADRSHDVHGAGPESVPHRRGPAEADSPGLRRRLARRA